MGNTQSADPFRNWVKWMCTLLAVPEGHRVRGCAIGWYKRFKTDCADAYPYLRSVAAQRHIEALSACCAALGQGMPFMLFPGMELRVGGPCVLHSPCANTDANVFALVMTPFGIAVLQRDGDRDWPWRHALFEIFVASGNAAVARVDDVTGNFEICDANGTQLWTTNSTYPPNFDLARRHDGNTGIKMQEDGQLVQYFNGVPAFVGRKENAQPPNFSARRYGGEEYKVVVHIRV